MDRPRKNPHIYEINTMTWLHSLCKREKRFIKLSNIPRKEWRYFKKLGMDIIWLMGIWQRSPYSAESVKRQPRLLDAYGEILNDLSMEDIEGSAYSIYDYSPDPALGTFEDLIELKETLKNEGLYLVLDFVPNHTSCDHPWTTKYPERYILDRKFDREGCREGFFIVNDGNKKYCLAHGRDPYFPPWNDTAQINYGNDDTVNAITALIYQLSDYCHGFRCDMAMLPLKDVFEMTWGEYLQGIPEGRDFWPYAIDRIRSRGDLCLLIAEAYWGKEKVLLDMGFDYAYDKYLYDLIVHGDVQGIKKYLSLPLEYQEKMVRFLENHDEPRAATVIPPEKRECAILIQGTLPGMRFWHHGQMEGNRIRVPVQLGRSPSEKPDSRLKSFYENFLKEINEPVFHDGEYKLCETEGWPDNESHVNLLAWTWIYGEERRLIVMNYSSDPVQGYVKVREKWLPSVKRISCYDPLNKQRFSRFVEEIEDVGLYVGLDSGGFHFFRIEKE